MPLLIVSLRPTQTGTFELYGSIKELLRLYVAELTRLLPRKDMEASPENSLPVHVRLIFGRCSWATPNTWLRSAWSQSR